MPTIKRNDVENGQAEYDIIGNAEVKSQITNYNPVESNVLRITSKYPTNTNNKEQEEGITLSFHLSP